MLQIGIFGVVLERGHELLVVLILSGLTDVVCTSVMRQDRTEGRGKRV